MVGPQAPRRPLLHEVTFAGKANVMSQEEQWWNDLMTGWAPFVLGLGYLVMGLLYLGLATFAHKNDALLLGVGWLVLSAANLGVGVVRRRRRRTRSGSEAR